MEWTPQPRRRPLKRLLIGRPVHSARLEHTLLSTWAAVPVLGSSGLSSVTYATEGILAALLAVTGAAHLAFPVAVGIGLLMLVVGSSFLRLIRAYPGGGGAYGVSREHLGPGVGLVAAAALLVDYTMTSVVSVVAGVFALTSVVPAMEPYRVALCLGAIALVTLLNLRGAHGSVALFVVPTYGFVTSILVLVAAGLLRCIGGCPAVAEPVVPAASVAGAAGVVTVAALLRSFASGSTALTGIEAVSDGVTAVRRPRARIAVRTLLIMVGLGLAMFLGLSWLASHVAGITVSDQRSVIAQLGVTVLGRGPAFVLVQGFTVAVLIVAADTAYQGFSRLSSLLARDHYMPRQFRHRGARLVYANGVLGLGMVSAAIVWVFDADLSRLVPVYVVGVFTALTLAQAGLARRDLREPGGAGARWRAVVAGAGAAATGAIVVAMALTDLRAGTWLAVLAIAAIAWVLRSIHRHYEAVREQLERGVQAPGVLGTHHVVLLVRRPDNALARALSYLRSFNPEHVHALYPSRDGRIAPGTAAWWESTAGGFAPLEPLAVRGELLTAVRDHIRSLVRGPRDFVTVVVPESRPRGLARYLLLRRPIVRLKAGLLREPGIVVTDVPVPHDALPHPWRPDRTVALVFVNAVNDATVRAANYAASLGAADTRAVYFDLDPDVVRAVQDEWLAAGGTVPLDILEAPYRDLPGHMVQLVRSYTARPDTLVTVVIPELVVAKWRHALLHNQYSLLVKGLMLFEHRVVLSSVPFAVTERASVPRKQ